MPVAFIWLSLQSFDLFYELNLKKGAKSLLFRSKCAEEVYLLCSYFCTKNLRIARVIFVNRKLYVKNDVKSIVNYGFLRFGASVFAVSFVDMFLSLRKIFVRF